MRRPTTTGTEDDSRQDTDARVGFPPTPGLALRRLFTLGTVRRPWTSSWRRWSDSAMLHEEAVRNPFMLMLEPEKVLAAVERSEKLGRLRRRMCHPLDKPVPGTEGCADMDGSPKPEPVG
jgi:hypothetical protein